VSLPFAYDPAIHPLWKNDARIKSGHDNPPPGHDNLSSEHDNLSLDRQPKS